MKIKSGFVLRMVVDEYIVIPIAADETTPTKSIFTLSKTGGFLWKMLENEQQETDLVNALTCEYNVDQSTAENDVHNFILQLQEIGCME